jgi:hypothetical protein
VSIIWTLVKLLFSSIYCRLDAVAVRGSKVEEVMLGLAIHGLQERSENVNMKLDLARSKLLQATMQAGMTVPCAT